MYKLHWSKNSGITGYFGFRGQDSVKCGFFACTPGTEAQKTSTDDTLLEAEYKLFL